MNDIRPMPNTFRWIRGNHNHYFDEEHFLGHDALSDSWNSKNGTVPISIKEDLQININLSGFSNNEIKVEHYGNNIRVKANMVEEKEIKDEYLVKELHMKAYNEVFTVPKNVDTKRLYKSFDGKTLKISIPYLSK